MDKQHQDELGYYTDFEGLEVNLNNDPNEVIQMNIDKLKARYPRRDFDAYYSENRKEGDL